MNRNFKTGLTLFVLALTSLLFISPLVSETINYQGYLTDASGEPITGDVVSLTFTIYDAGGVVQWTSGEQTVEVINGFFNCLLGGSDAIPSSVFEKPALFLGIKVGDDPEISPRTELTSTPKAAVAYNLSGGPVETNSEGMVVKNANGDSAMVFVAGFDANVIRIHPPEPCVPPEPCAPAIEIEANNANRITIHTTDQSDGREMITLNNSPTEGTSIVGFNPQPEPPGMVAFEMLVGGGGKGPGGRMAVYNPNGPSASMEGGFFELKDIETTGNPSAMMEINSNYTQFNMAGVTPPLGGEPPVISMMVDADSAKVGIGTGAPSEALHVIGNIALTGEVVYITDTKLKTNIDPIDDAVAIVSGLNGVRYNYRHDEYPEMKLSQKKQVGLLAQDVEKVLPELVFEDDNGTKYVAYTKLTAVLIEAIKEQQETIDKLLERIEKLERLENR